MRMIDGIRHGFTLIELVVVVMILGILAAVAAPHLSGALQLAMDNGVKQTLSVIRAAIDQFEAQHNGTLPGADGNEATFKADLADYLRGNDFPACPVGEAKNNSVRLVAGSGTYAAGISATASTNSWVYEYQSGEFHVNSTTTSNDGVTTYDQF